MHDPRGCDCPMVGKPRLLPGQEDLLGACIIWPVGAGAIMVGADCIEGMAAGITSAQPL